MSGRPPPPGATPTEAFPPAVHHTIGDVQLAVHELGDGGDRPAVVFCHGFPELAYSWRFQLPAVADAGFRAIALDQRGYGASSAPSDVGAYDLAHLTGDLVGLLDALEIERAVFVGHDWGGYVTWAMPVLHPDRCAGAVGVCTPYSSFATTELFRSIVEHDDDLYLLWFQEPGVAEAVLDPLVRLLFTKILRGGVDPQIIDAERRANGTAGDFNPVRDVPGIPEYGEPIVTRAELDHFVEEFERTGFAGGINWYRNIDVNAAQFPHIGTATLTLPTLMLSAAWDPVLRPEMAAGMPDVCTDLEMRVIPRSGHWLQQEEPEAVNDLLVDWLIRRFG